MCGWFGVYRSCRRQLLLHQFGYEVVGLDINKEVVETVNRGDIHIVEPGLEAIIRDSVRSGRLKATLEAERADIFCHRGTYSL